MEAALSNSPELIIPLHFYCQINRTAVFNGKYNRKCVKYFPISLHFIDDFSRKELFNIGHLLSFVLNQKCKIIELRS